MKYNMGMMKPKEEVALGMGLLSEVSKQYEAKDTKLNIVYVREESIAYNPLNKNASMDDIDELAQLIVMNDGLEQPLVLREYTEEDGDEDYEYMLLTGERRLRAIRMNKERGIMTDYRIPCIIRNMDHLSLNLSRELKEDFSVLVTNSYRDKTDADIYDETIRWGKIYRALKANGEEYIDYTDQEGNVVGKKNILGRRVRELVADEIGVAAGTVQKVEEIEKHGTEEVKKALLGGRTNLKTANTIAKLEPEEQRKILKSTNGEITKEIVEKYTDKKEEMFFLTKEVFEKEVEDMLKSLDGVTLKLKASEKKKYDKALETLKKIVG